MHNDDSPSEARAPQRETGRDSTRNELGRELSRHSCSSSRSQSPAESAAQVLKIFRREMSLVKRHSTVKAKLPPRTSTAATPATPPTVQPPAITDAAVATIAVQEQAGQEKTDHASNLPQAEEKKDPASNLPQAHEKKDPARNLPEASTAQTGSEPSSENEPASVSTPAAGTAASSSTPARLQRSGSGRLQTVSESKSCEHPFPDTLQPPPSPPPPQPHETANAPSVPPPTPPPPSSPTSSSLDALPPLRARSQTFDSATLQHATATAANGFIDPHPPPPRPSPSSLSPAPSPRISSLTISPPTQSPHTTSKRVPPQLSLVHSTAAASPRAMAGSTATRDIASSTPTTSTDPPWTFTVLGEEAGNLDTPSAHGATAPVLLSEESLRPTRAPLSARAGGSTRTPRARSQSIISNKPRSSMSTSSPLSPSSSSASPATSASLTPARARSQSFRSRAGPGLSVKLATATAERVAHAPPPPHRRRQMDEVAISLAKQVAYPVFNMGSNLRMRVLSSQHTHGEYRDALRSTASQLQSDGSLTEAKGIDGLLALLASSYIGDQLFAISSLRILCNTDIHRCKIALHVNIVSRVLSFLPDPTLRLTLGIEHPELIEEAALLLAELTLLDHCKTEVLKYSPKVLKLLVGQLEPKSGTSNTSLACLAVISNVLAGSEPEHCLACKAEPADVCVMLSWVEHENVRLRRAACSALCGYLGHSTLRHSVVNWRGLQPIVELMPTLPHDALHLLMMVPSKLTEAQKYSVVFHGAVSNLLDLLTLPREQLPLRTYDVYAASARVLMELLPSPQTVSILMRNNCAERLVAVIGQVNLKMEEKKASPIIASACVLARLCYYKEAHEAILACEVITCVCVMLQCNLDSIRSVAALLLSQLTVLEDTDISAVVSECLPALFTMIADGSAEGQVQAARALASLSFNSNIDAEELGSNFGHIVLDEWEPPEEDDEISESEPESSPSTAIGSNLISPTPELEPEKPLTFQQGPAPLAVQTEDLLHSVSERLRVSGRKARVSSRAVSADDGGNRLKGLLRKTVNAVKFGNRV